MNGARPSAIVSDRPVAGPLEHQVVSSCRRRSLASKCVCGGVTPHYAFHVTHADYSSGTSTIETTEAAAANLRLLQQSVDYRCRSILSMTAGPIATLSVFSS